MKYILKGKPIPLKRPKLSTRPVPHAYDPQKHIKKDSQTELRIQHGYSKLIQDPISLDITFFMPIPISLSKKKKKQLTGQKHYKRPDLSNLIKYLEDIAQGILFRDDAIISTINAKKIYDPNPRTEFIIKKEIKDEKEKESA